MGGAHINQKGLHLGHLYGTIIPLIVNNISDNVFFLLGDTKDLEESAEYQKSISVMCSQIYAINKLYKLKIRIIRQSILRKNFSSYYFDVLKYITKSQYRNVLTYQQKHENSYVSEILYPLDTLIALMLLKIDSVLLTGNDHKIVSFSRKILKKVSTQNPHFVYNPILYYKKDDFVKGWNYKKMGSMNHNCIYISDNSADLERKILKLFDLAEYKKYMGIPKEYSEVIKITNAYLPIQYMNQFFSKQVDFEELSPNIRKNLEKELFKRIYSLVSPIKQCVLTIDRTESFNQMLKDEEEIINSIICREKIRL